MKSDDEPHALYRFYDDRGDLLYVGLTNNPSRRWRDHGRIQPWWHDVSRVEIERHPDRDAVLVAERSAIESERPRYNVIHARPGVTVADSPDWPGCCVCGAAPVTCWSIDTVAAYSYERRMDEFNDQLISEGAPSIGGTAMWDSTVFDRIPEQGRVATFCEQHADQADYDFVAGDWRTLVADVGHVLANHEKMAAGSMLGLFLERVSNHGNPSNSGDSR